MKTITETFEFEERIQNSRFILFLKPALSKAQILAEINRLKTEHPHANHVCSAFVIKSNHTPQPQVGFDDDGEPNGSAGKPMLAPLVGSNLINVAAYIVRYFGGKKLGVGGLVRAYGGMVSKAVKEANYIDYIERDTYLLSFDYANVDKIKYVLNKNDIEISSTDFNENVIFYLNLSTAEYGSLSSELDRQYFKFEII